MPYLGIFELNLKLTHLNFSSPLWIAKYWEKKCLILVFLTKNAAFGFFETWIWKELSSYFILEFVLLQSLVQKLKSLKMRSKMDDTGIFISEFEKNIVIIKTSSLEFHIFVKKSKCLKYRRTMSHLGIFGLEFEKNNFIFEISLLELVLLQSLMRK